jgi:hypothetical protein
MKYTNDKIKQLIAEKDKLNSEFNYKINREIEKEKAKYKFSWKRFLLMIGMAVLLFSAFELNKKLFPKTSIWSWEYYKTK